MPDINFDHLLDYTDWERGLWREWFRKNGDAGLAISAGPHGDGRMHTVGDVIKHIFSAERRYVERLTGRDVTDTSGFPSDNAEALFKFGEESRTALRAYIRNLPDAEWEREHEFNLMNNYLKATPKKIIAHVLMHEIRHWPQVATLLRLNGNAVEMRDFLFSPVFGGEFRRGQKA